VLRCRLWEFYRNQTLIMHFRKSKKSKSCFFIFNWLYFLNTYIDCLYYSQDSPEFTWSNFMCFHILWTILYVLEFLLLCVPAPPPSPPHRCNPWWPTIFDLTTTLIYSDIFFEDRPIIISVSISVRDYITLM
jgi:hypothetical protein